MSSLAAKKMKLDERETVLEVCTCPACKGLFVDPKRLPTCHHHLCKSCIIKLTSKRSTITCPECFYDQHIKDVDKLEVNVQLQRAAELVKKANLAESVSKKSAGDSCPHLDFDKGSTFCDHCNKRFCQSCIFLHNERIRVEIAWFGHNLEKRWESSVSKFLREAPSIEQKIEQQAQSTEEHIRQSVVELERSLKLAVERYQQRMLTMAREIANNQHSNIRNLLDKSHATPNFLREKISQVHETSAISCSSKDLSKLYNTVLQRDREIFEFEAVLAEPFYGQLEYRPDPLLHSATEQIALCGHASLKWTYCEESHPDGKIPTPSWHIHHAAKKGDVDKMKSLLVDLSPACLSHAVEHKDVDDNGKTALIQAAERGHVNMFKFLQEEMEANIDAATCDSYLTALHLAAENGQLEIMKALNDFNSEIVDVEDANRYSPLSRAAAAGMLEVVKFLVEVKHADVEKKGSSNMTPLLLAIERGKHDVVEYLASKGAKFDSKFDDNGCSVFHLAVSTDNLDMLRLLHKLRPDLMGSANKDGEDAFLTAAKNNRLGIVKFFVSELGVDLTKKNKFEENALMVAAFNGSRDVVKFFRESYPTFVENSLCEELGKEEINSAVKLVENGNYVGEELARLRNSRRQAKKAKRDAENKERKASLARCAFYGNRVSSSDSD